MIHVDRCSQDCLCRRCVHSVWDGECVCPATWRTCVSADSWERVENDPECCRDFEDGGEQ